MKDRQIAPPVTGKTMNKIIDTEQKIPGKKLKRKSFFVFSGAFMFGLLNITKLPFQIFQSKLSPKEAPLKIRVNPNAVKRKSREVNNA